MQKLIKVAAIDDGQEHAVYEARADEIKNIFALADKLPDSWLAMDADKLIANMAREMEEAKKIKI